MAQENLNDSQLNISASDKKGKLDIFFGYAAGVGKTYAMLVKAHELIKNGVDLVVGYIEPHNRQQTIELLKGLPKLGEKTIIYRNIKIQEFDLDAALERKPQVILVDELAHTNAIGARNKKRYQDIEELLNAGIDVFTTVNVQHIESLNNIVEDITKIKVRETIPDYIFERANNVRLIDIEPVDLLKRIAEGKIYAAEKISTAMSNFFTLENLTALREISMREAADKISGELAAEGVSFDKKPQYKFLVCIGPSPSSAKCIRWTARASEAFHSPWTAVYVKTPNSDYFTAEQQKTVNFNMNLAERLGAEVITLTGQDIAPVIAEYVKLESITNVVIGKSGKPKGLFSKKLEDKIVDIIPNAEVHIVSNTSSHNSYKNYKKVKLARKADGVLRDVIKTVMLLTAATLISWGLKLFNIGEQNIIMVYIFSVLIISRVTYGYLYGITASFISVILFNFFFMEPYLTFTVIQSVYSVTFILMLLVSLVTSTLTVRVKKEAKTAVEREHRTHSLYEINRKLLITRGTENISGLITDYIVKLFSMSAAFYTDENSNGAILALNGDDEKILNSESEKAVAQWVFINNKQAGAGTDTLSGAQALYIPVVSQGNILGVIGILCASGELTQDNRLFLQAIASLAAMALERNKLSSEQNKIIIETEKEKIRNNLLTLISYDLKAPLREVFDASTAVLDTNSLFNKSDRKKLLQTINEDLKWIMGMVDNFLSIAHITSEENNIEKEEYLVKDIVSEALLRIRNRYPETGNIEINIEKNLKVMADKTLLKQVLINFLESAIKFSPENYTIKLNASKKDGNIVFEIKDGGQKILNEDLAELIDNYQPNEKQNPVFRAVGIGFLTSKAIIESHGGKIEAEDQTSEGTTTRFILPN